VYLTDFGLTRHVTAADSLTEGGRWVGTLPYVAPEQIRDEGVSPRTDVYSLGCVLYELLTGEVVFPGKSTPATLWAHLADPPPVPSELVPDLPAAFDDVVRTALAKKPAERFATAGELGRETLAAVGLRGPGSSGPRTVPPSTRVDAPPAPPTTPPAEEPVRVPLPINLDAAGRPTLFGRSSQLAFLGEALEKAHEGGRRAVLLAGSAGIGKTALSAKLAVEAHESGAIVLYGRCDEELPIPYRPFVEAFGHLVDNAPLSLLEDHVRDHGGVLAKLAPQLGQRLGGESRRLHSTQGDLQMLYAAAAGMIGAASASRPVVMVLDDLHWADPPTVLLLRHLLTCAVPMNALIVGSFRPGENVDEDAVLHMITDLTREADVDRLDLRGLKESDVVEMVRARARQDLDEEGVQLARTLHGETGGNPFFAIEILRNLAESGQIVRSDGRWSARQEISDLLLPSSVVETIVRRVTRLAKRFDERLASRAKDVLATAAVMGREIDASLLARVLEEDEDDVLTILEAARKAALLDDAPGIEGDYSFSHALVGAALCDELGPARLRRTHRRIAETLEEIYPDPGPRIGEIARHWDRGFRPGEAGKALDYLRRAADYALAQLAPDEAFRLYSSALERHEEHPEGGEHTRCELLIGLGTAQLMRGDADFRETLLGAARLAQRIDSTDCLVKAALANTRGFVSETGEVDTDRVAVLKAALEAVGSGDSVEHARLKSTLAAELTFADDWPRRLEYSNEAVEMARRLGDPSTLSAVLSIRFMAIWTPETLAERDANTREELAIVEQAAHDLLARFWALHWRATVCVELGELHEAARRVEEESRIAERSGQPTARWLAAYDTATQALIRGDLEQAEHWAGEAGRIGFEGGQPEALPFAAAQMVNIRYEQGRLIELEPGIEREAIDKPQIPAFWAALTLARAEAGLAEGARQAMSHHLESGFEVLPLDSNWLVELAIYAEACAHLRHVDAAIALERHLAPWTEQIAFNSATVWGFVARLVGVLEAVLGRLDRAIPRLEQVAESSERIDVPIWLARTRADLGEALLARGQPNDLDRALRLLDQAREAAVDLGSAMVAARAERLLNERQTDLASAAPAHLPPH
jgi:hypothetical protein